MSPAEARRVIEEVAQEYQVDHAVLISKRRTDALVRARAEAARRLHAGNLSMTQIGEHLHRHHTMVVYYLGHRGKKLSEKLATQAKMKWRRPRVRDITPPPPRKVVRCQVPYAGAEIGGRYRWVRLETQT